MNPAIVIVGNSTQGLGTIRSAATLNMPVNVLHDVHFCSSRFSRHTNNFIKLPKNTIRDLADSSENDFLLNILMTLPAGYPSPLFGINEDIVNFFYSNRETLKEKYFIADNPYNLIFDKYEFNNLSKEENRIPTFLLKDINLENYKGTNFILKSRRGNKLKNFTGEKAVSFINLSPGIEKTIEEYFSQDELIVQKVINSDQPVKSSCAFSVDGEILGLFQYEKLRQHPNQFGTGTYLRSIYEDELKILAGDILRKLKYTGISEIEFILDDEDNNYKAIEMNPRTWKSIDFSTKCGQNLVAKYISYILGKNFDKSLEFKADQYWVDFFTDIPQMFRERKIFSYSKNFYECMWDKNDPVPFLSTIVFSPFILLKI